MTMTSQFSSLVAVAWVLEQRAVAVRPAASRALALSQAMAVATPPSLLIFGADSFVVVVIVVMIVAVVVAVVQVIERISEQGKEQWKWQSWWE
jgi:hypothetical protein